MKMFKQAMLAGSISAIIAMAVMYTWILLQWQATRGF